jgi:hypothetical protein
MPGLLTCGPSVLFRQICVFVLSGHALASTAVWGGGTLEFDDEHMLWPDFARRCLDARGSRAAGCNSPEPLSCVSKQGLT